MLSPDFREFIRSLNANDVRYLVIGGYAVALHGHPRYTKDLDIWLEGSEENAKRLIQAISDFGFGSLDLKPEDFMEPDQVIQLGYPPNRIDLVTFADGVDFADCYSTRVTEELDGVAVQFISLENLRKNKKASGRPQDLADLAALE
ncbi:MAG TPA: DUF6036 family nucleotidyltransferase [Candidatus Obscuribacterales bacterium]